MGWSWHDVQTLPSDVYDVLIAKLSEPVDDADVA